jgi:hypothetical protein
MEALVGRGGIRVKKYYEIKIAYFTGRTALNNIK